MRGPAVEHDQMGNPLLIIPRGWQPRCRPADKRRWHDAKHNLARMYVRLTRTTTLRVSTHG